MKRNCCRTERRRSQFASSRHLRDCQRTKPFVTGRQFLRSGTSLAANYRAACRARSAADFISKISVVVEETDETLFWLEVLVEAELAKKSLVEPLMKECQELLKLFSASLATAKRNR